MNSATIVQKLWNYCNVLRDDGNLTRPDVIAQEIVDDLEAVLEQFRLIAADLQADGSAGASQAAV